MIPLKLHFFQKIYKEVDKCSSSSRFLNSITKLVDAANAVHTILVWYSPKEK